jgi:hypothetical protein
MLPTLRLLERGTLSYTKYISVTARATRQALKEEERVKADKRGDIGLRYRASLPLRLCDHGTDGALQRNGRMAKAVNR